MKPILEVNNLTMDFGGLRAIDNLNISIQKGKDNLFQLYHRPVQTNGRGHFNSSRPGE